MSDQTLQKQSKHTLNSHNLEVCVKCPPNETLNGWLAINTVEFYNLTNLLYGCVSEFCTEETCPVMGAGKWEYQWKDGKHTKAVKVPACEYVRRLMTWISGLINDETFFPDDPTLFPKHFMSSLKKIFTRLFRVYAHIYYSHFEVVTELGFSRHLNTAFKHFVLFVMEFELVEKKDMKPLESTAKKLLRDS